MDEYHVKQQLQMHQQSSVTINNLHLVFEGVNLDSQLMDI